MALRTGPYGDGFGTRPEGLTLAKVMAFLLVMLVLGRRLLPRLLWWVSRTGSQELFTLCVVAVAVGVAFGAAKLFDVSFALGAFFAGMMMRESEFSHRAADESLPLRDAFAVLFFVSVGMLFDPAVIWAEPLKLLAVVLIILFGKTLAAVALVLLFRYPLNTALTVAVGLAQIGEFSFILAGLGVSLALLPERGRDLILAGAIISILLNPVLFVCLGNICRSPLAELAFALEAERAVKSIAQGGEVEAKTGETEAREPTRAAKTTRATITSCSARSSASASGRWRDTRRAKAPTTSRWPASTRSRSASPRWRSSSVSTRCSCWASA